MKRYSGLIFFALVIFTTAAAAQQSLVTYAGNSGRERFNAICELSDGTVLVAGGADDLNWIPGNAPQVQIAASGINNAGGTGKIGFVLHLSGNLQIVLRVIYFPAGAVEEINFIKTTNAPGQPTGQIYLSGKTQDSRANGGGYFIARLNDNFVNGVPSALAWAKNIWATGDHQIFQPWDVGGDGKVVFATGEPFGANWAAVERLKADGASDVVPDWRYHTGTLTATGAAVEGAWTPAASRADVSVQKSSIVLKTTGRCEMRSWTQTDYSSIVPDGNGATKQGKYPLDLFFNSPCNPAAPTGNSPGYTGYSIGANPTQRVGGITVDRRNNHIYLGFAIQSRLPDGNPDFEPAVAAMTDSGALKWWSRLYRETAQNSTPDQYVDGLAIDYSKPAATTELTVLARSHGNNVVNLWAGNSISAGQNPANPGGSFHNNFTGTSGNIHISWIGKLRVDDGTLMYATYNAEYVDGATNFGAPYSEAIHDGWANHNGGWADLNTTRCKTDVKLDQSGRVYLSCIGRRTITTQNAFQKMVKYNPNAPSSSSWNAYVRVYEPNLKTLAYSSLLVGNWDLTTGAGGDNTDIAGVCPTASGVLTVGYHKSDAATGAAKGNSVPTANVPAWGASAPIGESAILAKFAFSNSATAAPRRKFDFDGDGRADIGIFRASTGAWHLNRSTAGYTGFGFGQNGDSIAPADYDGDGKTDVAVFRAGTFYRLNSGTGAFVAQQFGQTGDLPVPGDFDGDGKADVCVFRPSNSNWYRINSGNGQFIAAAFGQNGDKPQVADFDADGKTDLAVFRPLNGGWYRLRSSNNSFVGTNFGQSGDIAATDDYDGDGRADICVFRPSTGAWYRINSANNQFVAASFGTSKDIPTAADYDGDGKTDIAVFRPSNGTWYSLRSTAGFTASQFGANGDTPVPAAFGR